MQNTDIQKYFDNLLKESQDWAKNSLPKIVGREAVAHFKENFDQEGFVDNGLKKWKDVKRRDPSSKWYGFDYKGEKRVSYRFKRDRKTGKTYKVKQQKKLNFSKAATIRKILSGSSGDLRKSIRYIPKSGKVSITSDKPYAYVQNYGKYSINSLVYWVTYVHNVVYSFYRSMIYCYINSTQRCAGSIVIDIIPTNGADKRKFFPFAPYFPVTNVIKRYFYPYFPAIIGIKGYSFPYFPYLSGIMKIKTALYSLFSRLDWHKTVVFPCLGEIYEGIRSLSWEIPVT